MTLKIFYMTFGCKVNQYETRCIAERFAADGHIQTDDPANADVCVINSCTVTSQADSKLRHFINRLERENSGCVKVLAGCFPQAFADKAEKLGCDIVIGSRNKTDIPQLVYKFLSDKMPVQSVCPHPSNPQYEPMSIKSDSGRTRAYLKIQDGCDNYCTYCIIPYSRGHICSKPPGKIVEEAKQLISAGHKELVLTGINLCCYGRDLGGIRLIDAAEVVCALEGDFRIRLGSVEPELISDEDIARMSRLEKLCPHFHLSLQSGCDKTLKAMGRRYDSTEYEALCEKLRAAFPGCAVTTDIMVGFPGESIEDFEESLSFAERIAFAAAHIFPYSRRSGTKAYKMPEQLTNKEKSSRAAQLAKVCALSSLEYNKSYIGKTVEVLFEREDGKPYHCGHSREYIEVRVPYSGSGTWRRQFKNIRIISAESGYCIGEEV